MAQNTVIAIDAREAYEPRSGKAHYTYNITKSLITTHTGHRFVLYTKHHLKDFDEYENVQQVIIKKRHLFWHMAVIRDWMKRANQAITQGMGAVYFAPTSFIVPALLAQKYRRVVTVHDLIAFKEETHQKKAVLLEKLFLKRALARARNIVVPSLATQHDLVGLFPNTQSKIVVTPLGVDHRFFEATEVDVHAVRTSHALQGDFVLTVGGLEPRKNIITLIRAYLELPTSLSKTKLVIVGGMGWHNAEVLKLIDENPERIVHLTGVATHELPALYKTAKAFVFPSLYEGFGLPPLEAMAAGCPVLCSNAASLPEVCGDAGLMFDPKKPHELANKLTAILANTSEQLLLSEKGKARAKTFTWGHCAALTASILV